MYSCKVRNRMLISWVVFSSIAPGFLHAFENNLMKKAQIAFRKMFYIYLSISGLCHNLAALKTQQCRFNSNSSKT